MYGGYYYFVFVIDIALKILKVKGSFVIPNVDIFYGVSIDEDYYLVVIKKVLDMNVICLFVANEVDYLV
jgi:hypothetical protein